MIGQFSGPCEFSARAGEGEENKYRLKADFFRSVVPSKLSFKVSGHFVPSHFVPSYGHFVAKNSRIDYLSPPVSVCLVARDLC